MITVFNAGATLDDLRNAPVHRPKNAGRYWKGIRHNELVESIVDECSLRRWKVNDMKFALGSDGASLAGAFDLSLPNIDNPEGQTLSLGLLTSNDMKRRLRLVVGSTVLVCNNGMAVGEVLLLRKHTIGFDLFDEIETALDQYEEKVRQIPRLTAELQERELSPDEVDQVLMAAGRQKLLPWSRIGKVDAEYRHPTFRDHAVPTSWGLYNAFTHIAKQSPPLRQMDEINGFRYLLPKSGSVVPAVAA